MPQSKKKRGRPVTLTMPPDIPDTPENVAKALLTTPPKKRGEWQFLKEHKKRANASRCKE